MSSTIRVGGSFSFVATMPTTRNERPAAVGEVALEPPASLLAAGAAGLIGLVRVTGVDASSPVELRAAGGVDGFPQPAPCRSVHGGVSHRPAMALDYAPVVRGCRSRYRRRTDRR
jgi:hypothetical protein